MTNFPVTNADLQSSKQYREKDDFFYLVRLEKTSGVTHVHIDPDMPVVANKDALRDEVNASHAGAGIIARSDVKARRHNLGDDVRTLGVGVFPWVKMPDGIDRLVLLQKDKDAPAAPLAYMQPAGLVAGDDPVSALFREATEETCIMSVDEKSRTLSVQSFYLPAGAGAFLSKEEQEAIIARKPDNIDNIKRSISTYYPEYDDYNLVFSDTPLASIAHENYLVQECIFHMPDGREITAQGLINDDPVNSAVDFSLAIRIDMSHLKKIINVDPEPFCRNPELAAPDDIMNLGLVTAPLERYRDAMLDFSYRPGLEDPTP